MPDIFVSNTEPEEKKETPHGEEHKVLQSIAKTITTDSSDNMLHFLTSYCERPKGVFFTNLEEGEEIILFLRRQLVTNAPWIIKALVASLLPIFFFIGMNLLGLVLPLPEDYILVFTFFYYLVVLGYVFLNFISWFYNVSLVTTARVVDIDFSQLVYESVAATKLPQIEDVSYHQVGVLPSIFDYGDVSVQTAGSASNFLFASVPHPEKVVHIINGLIAEKGSS
ncbi:MAG: hypothetical protein A2186_01940 [Candidatus Levybacteria bacterium RIFOXYA1_FULL_41_10]|nr:MAG: seg [Candidatus Levybacteria bacterium GW2011_GWC1_40_19]KKR73300.1 MAG: hypothetical protein UU15_C0013G0003 [Candidatus Levybacteria bacterium GW2011_GWC2_40_7]KKR95164.1 MAG: hypothetical protein UU45_C0004G0067 [Candidatus Levybacteria bacterium GW2011_GWA2_41_15]OGH24682.1 MAG: hypothetical protein A3D82_00525 [Candidatus Levybacteria bacterium RIFCSPHIGHO2_02_FULL_40_29]OGH50888.1 MAG: hypothetical protein A3J18_01875 [Candidatus Levybacteria bacterium RIFCSPLOWO2_02_FULL_40_18]O